MKTLKIVLGILAFLVAGLALAGFFFYQQLKPAYQGEVQVPGMQQGVEVRYDAYGIPHIEAKTDEDAFRALGYVHAQDRLWQMELIRRVAPGRLSEIFGKDLVTTDQFFRTLGIGRYSEQAVRDLESRPDPTVRKLLQAYLDGVNAFQDKGPTPIEFTLLGLKKEHYTLVDFYNSVGYMAFSFANAHKTEPVMTAIAALGPEYLQAFTLAIPDSSTVIRSYQQAGDYVEVASSVADMFDRLPLAPFIGSNSWVLSKEKSATGQVMFCNDPHIGFAQPATWYEASISTPNLHYYGYHLALDPFALLLHTDRYATGLTMFENDDVDFYQERINPENPNQYYHVDHWETFTSRQETIRVKDGESVTFTVQESGHGPILNAALPTLAGKAPVAISWTYLKFPARIAEANYGMSVAKNKEEFASYASMIHAPGLNVMYGDVDGNIAWWAVGKLVKRPAHVNPNLILDGASGADDPQGYYDFSENPQSVNPPQGYVYSANNQSELNLPGQHVHYPGYYLSENRAKRIVQVLDSKPKFDRADMKALFLDNTNLAGIQLQAWMVRDIDPSGFNETERKALENFKAWNGKHEKGSLGAALYYPMVLFSYENAMKDELAAQYPDQADALMEAFMEAHVMKVSMPNFFGSAQNVWWDDVKTKGTVETRKSIFTTAFRQSIAYLIERHGDNPGQWQWEKIHTLVHNHAMGKVEALSQFLNVGPFEVEGADETLNNLGFEYGQDGLHRVSYGPSTRRMIDFSDVNSSESILPTGQSGNPSSTHYRDQSEMYAKGQWRRMLFDRKSIEKGTKEILLLKPVK